MIKIIRMFLSFFKKVLNYFLVFFIPPVNNLKNYSKLNEEYNRVLNGLNTNFKEKELSNLKNIEYLIDLNLIKIINWITKIVSFVTIVFVIIIIEKKVSSTKISVDVEVSAFTIFPNSHKGFDNFINLSSKKSLSISKSKILSGLSNGVGEFKIQAVADSTIEGVVEATINKISPHTKIRFESPTIEQSNIYFTTDSSISYISGEINNYRELIINEKRSSDKFDSDNTFSIIFEKKLNFNERFNISLVHPNLSIKPILIDSLTFLEETNISGAEKPISSIISGQVNFLEIEQKPHLLNLRDTLSFSLTSPTEVTIKKNINGNFTIHFDCEVNKLISGQLILNEKDKNIMPKIWKWLYFSMPSYIWALLFASIPILLNHFLKTTKKE
ncbi:hypothetical protein GCM10011514_52980 [Emticicia aquatilis]|uniref:Uncharacterized protein n=1 Tax=Emticicia aquatilis TaxID=1537369 RepID=A0A917DY11_9BACT|nr:hypothetical protein [Emticicia aquatilis]GGD82335.1 hypothetical protein GCM10011514_52980 [Emticicia aquatilis]